jgi:transposase
MMGRDKTESEDLFSYSINLEKRVRSDHPLRRIKEKIDFDFIYNEVSDKYGINGNVSVPPPVILKLVLLLVFYNVRSERELISTLPERLDWLWFLGMKIDDPVPDHSVLSKARRRWGVGPFRMFFERIIFQCVEAGLVDGSKIFVDSCLVDADASLNSITNAASFHAGLGDSYIQLAARLEEKEEDGAVESYQSKGPVNRRFLSKTDPDSSITRIGGSKPYLRYKVHRAVDEKAEIITASITTPAAVNEAHEMIPLSEQHRLNTGLPAETVVADSKYGTIENFLSCSDRGLKAHISDLRLSALKRVEARHGRKIFPSEMFIYDAQSDSYTCPAGNRLVKKSRHFTRSSADYGISKKFCDKCPLKKQCTDNKTGRTLKRHFRQDELDKMRKDAGSHMSKTDIRKRQHLMERSFATGKRYGIKRARWRGLQKMEIQELCIATVQNILKLVNHSALDRGCTAIAEKTGMKFRINSCLNPTYI